MKAFINLQKQLISEPVMAFPRTDQQYALITDAATGTADTPGGLGAILTQVDQDHFLAHAYKCFVCCQRDNYPCSFLYGHFL